MQSGIDLNRFYQGLDALFQQKDSRRTMDYLEGWLQEAQQMHDTSGIVAVSNELGGLCRAVGNVERAKELYRSVLVYLILIMNAEYQVLCTGSLLPGFLRQLHRSPFCPSVPDLPEIHWKSFLPDC